MKTSPAVEDGLSILCALLFALLLVAVGFWYSLFAKRTNLPDPIEEATLKRVLQEQQNRNSLQSGTGAVMSLPQAMEKLVKFTRENPRAGIFQAAEKKP